MVHSGGMVYLIRSTQTGQIVQVCGSELNSIKTAMELATKDHQSYEIDFAKVGSGTSPVATYRVMFRTAFNTTVLEVVR